MDATYISSLLSTIPPFTLLDERSRLEVARQATRRTARFGDTVIAEGDAADAMYVIVSGKARIVGRNTAGEETSLALLKAGAHFGDAALISDSPRTATVRAADDLVLIRIERKPFMALLERIPEARSATERYLNDIAVQNFLKQFTELGQIPSHVLRSLVTELEELRVEKGAVVVRQGQVGDRFYIVRSGILEARIQDGAAERVVGQMGEGEYFGELALLSGLPRAATVVACSACDLFAMSKVTFDRVIASAPDVKTQFQEHAARYRSDHESAGEIRLPPDPEPAVESEDEPTAEPEDSGPVQAPLWRRLFKRYPHVRQHDETDCSAACLSMVTTYYNVPVGVSRLRDMVNVDADGANLWSLAQAAETLGFHTRGLYLSYEAIQELTLPAIVHWEGFHYIVLYEAGLRHVVVGDPARSLRRLTVEEFRRGWTGRALEVTPTARLKRTERIKTSFERFLPILARHRAMILEVLAASLLMNIFGLGIPFFTQLIMDKVLVHRTEDLLNVLLAGILLIAGFHALVNMVRRFLLVHISTRADATLFAEFIRHTLELPMRFFDLRRVGDVISRVSENETIRSAMVSTIPGVVLDTLLAFGYFALMAWYNPRLTLLVMAVAALLILLTALFTPAIRRNRQDQFSRHTDAWSTIIETFTGIGTVKSMAIETNLRWKMESQFVESLVVARKGAQIETVYSSLGTLLQMVGSALFLWYGARQVMAGALSTGQMFAFVAMAANVIQPILRTVEAWDELLNFRNAVDRVNDVFDSKPEEPPGRQLLTLKRIEGHLRFQDVTFKYTRTQDKPTLAGVTLEIQPGETIAVVGRSGSGKSTLGKLLIGLYLPTTGRVYIDGHDLRTLSHRHLRRRVGVVPQDVFLFSGSIRDNIAMFNPDMPFDRIVKAARQADAHAFISAMGMGYDTKVGERGMSMSGGQRQRIALARALLNEPDILLLDEATSALDNQSERAIQKNLGGAADRRTMIVIAHRLSTVKTADRILVVDSGVIVEQGSHNELIKLNGLYATLAGQQVSE